jgi:predicted acetyltransferase
VLQPISYYFGHPSSAAEHVERFAPLLPPERAYAAWSDGRVVGGAASFLLTLTVPRGRRIAAAGVTLVGVLPTHRRRGILLAMMRSQLDACHAAGESVAFLWASEDAIYGRFGYGVASFSAEIDLPRHRAAYEREFSSAGYSASTPPLSEARTAVASIWEHVAGETPGMFARTPAWWQIRALGDPAWQRAGRGEKQCVVLDRGGRPSAYALYRLTATFERGIQTGAVDVVEAMGETPEATAAVWRFLLDIDWMARVRASLLPLDHPLLLLLEEPRQLRFSVRDGLWIRLVDVGRALAARQYGPADAVTIDVMDEFCPWNRDRWRVSSASVARTNADPDLRCDVSALGSVYLGGFTWRQLARALRVEELRKGAIARADALFVVDGAPWCPEVF